MAQFHFVEDYERLVDRLLAEHPIDAAMEMAVGGLYDAIGKIEVDILLRAGLRTGMSLLDMGCGSGRLSAALGKSGLQIDYLGVDIVQKLLDYAATRSPPNYRFLMNRSLFIPAQSDSLDVVCAFSLFTHLLHHETYLYLQEIHRVLRPRGKLVFSFLELGSDFHWPIFMSTVEAAATDTTPHLNSFIERSVITLWASKLDFSVENFIGPTEAVSPVGPLGQSTAIVVRN